MKKNFYALLFGCTVSILLIFALEFFCFLANKFYQKNNSLSFIQDEQIRANIALKHSDFKNKIPSTFLLKGPYPKKENPFKFDPEAITTKKVPEYYLRFQNGIRSLPKNSKILHTLYYKKTMKEIYSVDYIIDDFSRRITPIPIIHQSMHAAFLGCSYTFGEGVNSNETLPYFAIKNSKKYVPYNLGIPGNSPGDSLAQIRYNNAFSGIKEKNGIAMYTLISDHLRRTIQPLSFLGSWGHKNSYWEFIDGGIKYRGQNSRYRPNFVAFAKLFSSLNITKYFRLDWPYYYNEEDFNHLINILKEIRNEYWARFSRKKRFIVLLVGSNKNFIRNIIPALDNANIEYLDYSEMNRNYSTFTKKYNKIPYDSHPTAELYEVWGKHLARDLKL